MKFLIDAQLPKKLCKIFEEEGFDTIHTLDLPDKNKTKDSQINQITINQIFKINLENIIKAISCNRLIEITTKEIIVRL